MAETNVNSELRRTPLHESHKRLGAKFVSFGGWEMPVSYSGVVKEHQAVRNSVGLFDVSHMGEISVKGKDAAKCLNYLLSNDVSKIKPGRAQYSVLLTENGTPVDDLIVYQIAEDDYMLCVNASNTEKDFAWITSKNDTGKNDTGKNKFDVEIKNVSDALCLIAVQGPNAIKLCELLTKRSLSHLESFSHEPLAVTLNGEKIEGTIARTGYTGEDGFEIYCNSMFGEALWEELLAVGKDLEVLPIGLAARDSLRLEAALCLYGHELKEDIDILSAGLGWVTKFNKSEFVGKDALLKIKEDGPKYKLVGLELLEPGIAREETVVSDVNGEKIGFVTSGTLTPTLQKSIAIAYLDADYLKRNSDVAEVMCVVRNKPIRSKIVRLPFYRKATK